MAWLNQIDKADIISNNLIVQRGKIGSGCYADIYVGFYKKLNHKVAIKKFTYDAIRDEEDVKQLLGEFKAMKKVRHGDNVVTLHGIMVEYTTPIKASLVMEYMCNKSLRHFQKSLKEKEINFPWILRTDIVSKVISGMAFLHAQRILHRDLKLENVLVGNKMEIKIADFGLSITKTYYVNEKSEDTAEGTLVYIAPECLMELDELPNEKQDVYSFAIMAWELCSGEIAFKGARNKEHLWMAVAQGKRRPKLDTLRSEKCPLELIDIMVRCWAHDAKDRPRFQDLGKEMLRFDNPKFVKQVEEERHEVLMAIMKYTDPTQEEDFSDLYDLVQPSDDDILYDEFGFQKYDTIEGAHGGTVEGNGKDQNPSPVTRADQETEPSGKMYLSMEGKSQLPDDYERIPDQFVEECEYLYESPYEEFEQEQDQAKGNVSTSDDDSTVTYEPIDPTGARPPMPVPRPLPCPRPPAHNMGLKDTFESMSLYGYESKYTSKAPHQNPAVVGPIISRNTILDYELCFGRDETKRKGLKCPFGIASHSLYGFLVCDTGNARVLRHDMYGRRLRCYQRKTRFRRQFEPYDIATTTDFFVVTNPAGNCLYIFTYDGDVIRQFGDKKFKFPWGVAITSENRIVVVYHRSCLLVVYTSHGQPIQEIGSQGKGQVQFNDPTYVTITESHNYIVCDRGNSRIQIITPNGEFLSEIVGVNPTGVAAIGPNVLVYADDKEKTIMMCLYGDEFEFIEIKRKEDKLESPTGITITTSGKVAVVDNNGVVYVYKLTTGDQYVARHVVVDLNKESHIYDVIKE
ncbi:uncharacterized protein LOC144445585 [Glandiceps talaboti]